FMSPGQPALRPHRASSTLPESCGRHSTRIPPSRPALESLPEDLEGVARSVGRKDELQSGVLMLLGVLGQTRQHAEEKGPLGQEFDGLESERFAPLNEIAEVHIRRQILMSETIVQFGVLH